MIEKETKPKCDIGGGTLPTGSWAYIFLNIELIVINSGCVFSICDIHVYLRKFENICNK